MSSEAYFIRTFINSLIRIHTTLQSEGLYELHSGLDAFETWVNNTSLTYKEIEQWRELLKSIHLNNYSLDENAIHLIDSKTPTQKFVCNTYEEYAKMLKIAYYKKSFGLLEELELLLSGESFDEDFKEALRSFIKDLYHAVSRSAKDLEILRDTYKEFIDNHIERLRYLVNKTIITDY